MPDIDTVLGWRGRPVLDRGGEKVGTLGEIYLDDTTDRPAYAGVRTGLFKRRESVVPLAGAQETPDGIRLPHSADRITGAPNVDPDVALDDDEQQRLAAHFGAAEDAPGDDEPAAAARDAQEPIDEERAAPVRAEEEPIDEERAAPVRAEEEPIDAERAAPVRAEEEPIDAERAAPVRAEEEPIDEARAAPARAETRDDDAVEVVRSEEEVSFGTTPAAPRERVRLRKHVVTDHVEKTVPVRREEVRVETDPPPEGRIVDVEDA